MPSADPPAPSKRLAVTVWTMRRTAELARLAGRGGSVLGGHVGLRMNPGLIADLARGRKIVAVSATNGKTTTTNLLASALGTVAPTTTNSRGSNLATGIASTLASDRTTRQVALEVDEATLAVVAGDLHPDVVILGNLSRDQLDRYGEVRILAQRWRKMFETLRAQGDEPRVVANADDPLVVWSAIDVGEVVWVAAGAAWTADAHVCPSCTSPVEFVGNSWRCTGCPLARPAVAVSLDDDGVVFHDADGDTPVPLDLEIPGEFNRGNAALALAAARLCGVEPASGSAAMSATAQVAGRYRTVQVAGHRIRMLMAKNPSGWQAALGVLRPAPVPVVVAINARVADGHDPSWLFDVPFEMLAGRTVVAAGERARDLSVRLHYGGVAHTVVPGTALGACATLPDGDVDLIANYTAFADTLAALP